MKEFCLLALHLGSKVALTYMAYLAVANDVRLAGWFVFIAVMYVLGSSLKVD